VRPRIVGIDTLRQPLKLALHVFVAVAVAVVEERKALADQPVAIGEHEGLLAGQRGKGRHDREVQLVDQPGIGGMEGRDYLPAELHQAPIAQLRLLHASSRASTRLEHDDVRARVRQPTRRRQPGESAAEHHHVMPR
jgi:hypothetical protein